MTNSLKDYEQLFLKLSLTELEVQEGDFKLKLKKDAGAVREAAPMPEVAPEAAKESEEKPKPVIQSGTELKAPLLGVFYGSFGDKKAVKKGDKVSEGDVLCTLEAMKMMNEVKAPVYGTITAVLAAEGDLVEFDQVLFVIE